MALAVLQPNGSAEIATSMGVWIAAVRLPPAPAAAVAGAITAALAVAVGLTAHPEVSGRGVAGLVQFQAVTAAGSGVLLEEDPCPVIARQGLIELNRTSPNADALVPSR